MNVIPLLKAKEAIRQNPEHFSIHKWDCGSTACIAGWVLRLCGTGTHSAPGETNGEMAARILKISEEQGERLFFVSDWPDQFRTLTRIDHDGWREYEVNAQQACDRIDFFISTNGTDKSL